MVVQAGGGRAVTRSTMLCEEVYRQFAIQVPLPLYHLRSCFCLLIAQKTVLGYS